MPNTPGSIVGSRMTDETLAADQVKSVAPGVRKLQSKKKTLMTLIDAIGPDRSTDNARFSWFQREKVPKSGTVGVSAASAAASASAIMNLSGQGSAVYLKVDDVIKYPATGEEARVTATPAHASAVHVLRNITGGATASIAAGSLWVKIGNARAGLSRLYDSSGNLQSVSTNATEEYNYTQTFRTPIGMSRREMKTKKYTGKAEVEEKFWAMLDHCEEINSAYWHSTRLDEGDERTHTGGLLSFIPSANTDVIPTLTEDEVEDFFLRITRFGDADTRVLFCSRYVKSLISAWGRASQRITETGTKVKWGVEITTYLAGCGTTIQLVTELALEGLPGSTTRGVWDGYAACLDMEDMATVKFASDYMIYAEGVQFNDVDGKVNALLSDCGIDPGYPDKHGLITGITG
jgi:hypothetical protein